MGHRRTRHIIDASVFSKVKPLLSKGVSYKDITNLTGISTSTLTRMEKVDSFEDYRKLITGVAKDSKETNVKTKESEDNNLFLAVQDIRRKMDNLSSRFTNLIEVITVNQLSENTSSVTLELKKVLEELVGVLNGKDLPEELWGNISNVIALADSVLNKEEE